MDRQEKINKLIIESPKIMEIALTHDMGYEFTGISKDGVIFAAAGMLINYSGGEWPLPDKNEDSYPDEISKLFEELDYLIAEWEHVEDYDLDELISLL